MNKLFNNEETQNNLFPDPLNLSENIETKLIASPTDFVNSQSYLPKENLTVEHNDLLITESDSKLLPAISLRSANQKSTTTDQSDILTGNTNITTRATQIDNAGNEFTTAFNISNISTEQIFRDFVGDEDPVDYYRFNVTKKGTVLNLKLQGLTSNADISLYNSKGEYVDYSGNTGTTPEEISTPLDIGTYYIKVFPDWSSSANTPYTLTVTGKRDVGNTMKTAYNIGTLTTNKKLTDFIAGYDNIESDPADYYRFRVDKWSKVKLAVTGLENEANIALLNSSGTPIKSLDDVGQSPQTIEEILKPGTYYIKAETYWWQAKYDLNLSANPVSENPAQMTNLSFSGKEGDQGTLQIQLNQQPSSDVTLKFFNGKYLTIDADNDLLNGTQDTITFTPENWNQPRQLSFIAEVDGTKSHRKSGNTIDYAVNGGIEGGGSYNLGVIKNTYAPNNKVFNIDLDFRNDYLNFWNPARKKIAQQAANDWARLIGNELKNSYLGNQEILPIVTEQTQPFKVNRFVDDLVIFVNAYGKDDGWGGHGGPDNGYDKLSPLPTYGGISINSTSYNKSQDDSGIYNLIAHEIGHVLGLVGINYTSEQLIKGNQFVGSYSRTFNNGNNIPLQSDGTHPANMPSIMSYSYDKSTVTELDKRLLADSGYQVYGVNATGTPRKMSKFGQLIESSEKDNTIKTAVDIGLLNYGEQKNFKEFVGEVDWGDYYKFTVGNSGGTLNLTLDGLKSNAEVSLMDSQEKWLNGSYKPSNVAESFTSYLSAGTYYLQVYSPQDGTDTNYKLGLQLTPGNTVSVRNADASLQEKLMLSQENLREKRISLPM